MALQLRRSQDTTIYLLDDPKPTGMVHFDLLVETSNFCFVGRTGPYDARVDVFVRDAFVGRQTV
jgi:hypothetical protein